MGSVESMGSARIDGSEPHAAAAAPYAAHRPHGIEQARVQSAQIDDVDRSSGAD
jgi:hypothetical protein